MEEERYYQPTGVALEAGTKDLIGNRRRLTKI